MNAQTNKDNSSYLLAPEQMREDVQFFYKRLVETHPNPYYVISKEELEAKIQDVSNNLNTPLSKTEFWMRIAQFNCYFDVHTSIGINQNFEEYFKNQKNLLPYFTIILEDGYLFFNKNTTFWPDSLSGLQIESINNIPASRIIQEMESYHSYEYLLPQNFPEQKKWIEAVFPMIFYYLHGKVDTISLGYKNKEGEKSIYKLTELFPFYPNYPEQINDKIISEKENIYSTPKQGICDFKYYPQNSIAIIELNSSSGKEKECIRNALKKYMDSIIFANPKYLFIDISANGGGTSDNAYIVLSYLYKAPKRIYEGYSDIKVSLGVKELFTKDLNVFSYGKNFLFQKPFRKVVTAKNGKIIHIEWDSKQKKSSSLYKGEVYFIQSNRTFSAAVSLSSVFKCYKIGTIIGEETGGLTSCFIDSYYYVLPNSKIRFRSSIQHAVTCAHKEDNRGVLPDIEYKIENPRKSFTLEQLEEMLLLVEEKKVEDN